MQRNPNSHTLDLPADIDIRLNIPEHTTENHSENQRDYDAFKEKLESPSRFPFQHLFFPLIAEEKYTQDSAIKTHITGKRIANTISALLFFSAGILLLNSAKQQDYDEPRVFAFFLLIIAGIATGLVGNCFQFAEKNRLFTLFHEHQSRQLYRSDTITIEFIADEKPDERSHSLG